MQRHVMLPVLGVVLLLAGVAMEQPARALGEQEGRQPGGQGATQTGVPLVHGPIWENSTRDEKRAYLVGVANTLVVAEAVKAKRRGEDPSTSIARIDAWYKANPERRDLPVIGVVYLGIVQQRGG